MMGRGGRVSSAEEARLAILGSDRELLFESVFTVRCVAEGTVSVAVDGVDEFRVREEATRATRLGLEWDPCMEEVEGCFSRGVPEEGGGRMLPAPPREYCEYCQYWGYCVLNSFSSLVADVTWCCAMEADPERE